MHARSLMTDVLCAICMRKQCDVPSDYRAFGVHACGMLHSNMRIVHMRIMSIYGQVDELRELGRFQKEVENTRRRICRLLPPEPTQRYRKGPAVVARAGVPKHLSRTIMPRREHFESNASSQMYASGPQSISICD